MNCPSCSAVVAAGAKECPGCGVNFAKWTARAQAPAALGPVDAPVAAAASPFPKIALAAALAAGYGAYHRHATVPAGPAGGVSGTVAEVNAPSAPPTADSAAAGPAAAPAAPAPLSMAGYEAVWGEYSARAAGFNAAPDVVTAKRFFDSGKEEVRSLGFDEMEEAGLIAPAEPFSGEETQKGISGGIGARCLGSSGYVYLGGLPSTEKTPYSACWARKSGRAKSSSSFQVIYSPVLPQSQWVPASWQPALKGWSVWTPSQISQGAQFYVEKRYGVAILAEERRKADQKMSELSAKGRLDPATAGNVLMEGYRAGFRREGALAALAQLPQ